jgi:hypothetical protein
VKNSDGDKAKVVKVQKILTNNESLHLKIKAKIENWRPRPYAVPWLMVHLHVSPI